MPKHKPRRHQTIEQKLAQARAKGRRDAMNEVIGTAVYVMLYAPRDKCGATDDEIHRFSEAFRYEMDSIDRGYLTVQDIKDTLREEYGDIVKIT